MANRVSSTSVEPAKPTVNVDLPEDYKQRLEALEKQEPVNAVNEYIVRGWYVDPNGKRLRQVETEEAE